MPVFWANQVDVYGVISILLGLGFQFTCTKAYQGIGNVSAENKASKEVLLCVNSLSTFAAKLNVYFMIFLM